VHGTRRCRASAVGFLCAVAVDDNRDEHAPQRLLRASIGIVDERNCFAGGWSASTELQFLSRFLALRNQELSIHAKPCKFTETQRKDFIRCFVLFQRRRQSGV
jgi:hypothetical protein